MGRFVVLFLCAGLMWGRGGSQASAQPLPSMAPKLVIAVFQRLDRTKKLPPLLDLLQEAYVQRTGERAISSETLKQKLGHYGPRLLGKCQSKASCLSQSMQTYFPNTPYGLFLGVGGLGDTLLLNLLLVDLKTGKELKQLNQTFSNLQEVKTKLPQVMRELFPNYASIRWQGLPPNATVTINGKAHKQPRQWVGVPANQELQIVLSAPGYEKETKQIQLTANSQITQIVKLKPGVSRPPTKLRKRPDPPPRAGQPITRKWWFWTIIGVAAAGVGVGVGAAVLSSQNQRKQDGFITVDVPPVQP